MPDSQCRNSSSTARMERESGNRIAKQGLFSVGVRSAYYYGCLQPFMKTFGCVENGFRDVSTA